MSDLFDRAAKFFNELQSDICRALADLDGAREFGADAWQRPGGGGGVARVLEAGALFEKAGVNWSNVDGELPAELADHMPGSGREFRASGVSLVLHPSSPMVPTTHANFRCIQKGDTVWFGGGADLTPYYFFREDAVHFHETLADVARHLEMGSEFEGITPEKMLQGPFSDAMTHAGQLAMIRRLAGSPVPSENFIFAEIRVENLGPDQPLPAAPDEDWKPDL